MDRKTVLITGVSSGLGKAAAEKFRAEGFFVIGLSRSKPELEPDLWLQCDICSESQLNAVFYEISSRFKSLDVLINNAGIGCYEKWEDLPAADFRKIFELDFFALVAVTLKFLPLLKAARGTIINISSIASKIYVPCMGPYCASKAAVNAFSDTLRVELSGAEVKVLNVMPGRIGTGFSGRAMGTRIHPHSPGSSSPEPFAEKLFKAYSRGDRNLIFPRWYKFIVWFLPLFRSFYERENIKRWKI